MTRRAAPAVAPSATPDNAFAWRTGAPSVFAADRYHTPKRNGISGTQLATLQRARRDAQGKHFDRLPGMRSGTKSRTEP